MAREHATEESSSNSSVFEESSGEGGEAIPVTCPQCETRWTCEDQADQTCPDCGSAFSVRVLDEFALVERGGWTVAVSLATADRQGVVDG